MIVQDFEKIRKNLSQIWKKGDIVQINPRHDPIFGGCLMIVDEPKTWGAIGHFRSPDDEDLIHYRVSINNAVKVGRVIHENLG